MSAPTRRSASRNTLCATSLSTSVSTPSSAPCSIITSISAWVTLGSVDPLTRSARRIKSPVAVSSHTNGFANVESAFIGPTTAFATRSGERSPRRFGTSSPTTTEKNVIVATTRMTDSGPAYGARTGNWRRKFASGSLKRCATERAGEDADERDPDLHRGEEFVGVLRKRQRGGGPRVSRIRLLLESRFPG